jgi:hypothetical protein
MIPGMMLILSTCMNPEKSNEQFPVLHGEYLGQALPGDTAELFAPGIVSRGMSERDVAISPDGKELYFGASIGGFSLTTIMVSRQVEGRWTEPEPAPFCKDPESLFLEPAFNREGSRLFFLSDMEIEGSSQGSEDIWYVERIGGQWGEPVNLGEPINTEHSEFYPSLTGKGNLYFTRAEAGSRINFIYRSRYLNGKFQEPERLPEQVNCGTNRFNAFVSPAEDYIIVPVLGMEDSYGGVDYYIVFRTESDQWSVPQNMGPQVNSEAMREWSACASRDGKVLFFMSNRLVDRHEWSQKSLQDLHNSPGNGNSDIYWISAAFIDELRAGAVFLQDPTNPR